MLTDSKAGETVQDKPQPWLNPYAGNAQNNIVGKFQSLLFYHELVAPALIELHAINHLLSYCGFGLTMAGDKNGDGKLELCEVREYIQDLLQITGHDKCLVKGLNSLERNYNEIAGPKNYINEQDLIVRENHLNKLIQIRLLENEAILEQLAQCEPDELEELDLCVIVQEVSLEPPALHFGDSSASCSQRLKWNCHTTRVRLDYLPARRANKTPNQPQAKFEPSKLEP